MSGANAHTVTRAPDPELPAYERITLGSSGGVTAAFVPGAGMVGVSMTLDGVELLARRNALRGYLERSSTFGIPLLAPWANRLADEHQVVGEVEWDVPSDATGVRLDEFGQPIHGLVAGLADWRVEDVGCDEDSARLRARLRWRAGSPRYGSFPFEHDLVVDVALADRTLRIATALVATGEREVPVAFGWHPWFEFPDVPRAEWVLDLPFVRRATLGATKIPTGGLREDAVPAGPLGDLVLDDVFVDVPDGTVASVRAGSRGVSVRYVSGFPVAVVFAPAEIEIVCLEPMTAPTDPFSGHWPIRTAAPGEAVEAVFEVTAERH